MCGLHCTPVPTNAGSDKPSGQHERQAPVMYMLHAFTNVMLTRSYRVALPFTHLAGDQTEAKEAKRRCYRPGSCNQ